MTPPGIAPGISGIILVPASGIFPGNFGPLSTLAMGWWPGFLSLSGAWLFFLLLPIIVFYFLKLRRPRLEIPSLVLWQRVINDSRVNSPFQRFKRNLLLLVQLLLLCLLALAAMQPYWKGSADRSARVPILVDCSASMAAIDKPGGQTRLDAAKEKLRVLIEGLPSNQEICLVSFARSARKLTPFTNNSRILLEALDSITVQDVPSDLEDALRIAQALFRTEPFDHLKIYSDGNFPSRTNVQLPFAIDSSDYVLLPPAGVNLGITAASATRSGPKSWMVYISVEGSSPNSRATGTVELYMMDAQGKPQQIGKEDVSADAAHPAKLSFPIVTDQAASIELRLKPDGFDSLASDNSAYLDLEPPRHARIYASASLTAVREALAAMDQVDVYPPLSGTSTGSSGGASGTSGGGGGPSYDLAILDETNDAVTAKIDFTAYFGIIPRDVTPLVSLLPEPAEVVSWDRAAPLLQHVQLNDVIILDSPKYLQTPSGNSGGSGGVHDLEAQGYEVLADAKYGPLILQKREGPKLAYHVLFRLNRSNLRFRISFPIFIANLVQEAMARKGLVESPGHPTGVLPPIPLDPGHTYSVSGPAGDSRPAAADDLGVVSGVWAPRVGRYNLRDGSTPKASVGVSLLSASESHLLQAKTIQFAETSVTASEKPIDVDRSFWPKLAALALVLLALEWWLYQRKPGPFFA